MTISKNHHHRQKSSGRGGNNRVPDAVSALKFLPAAILALALSLPVQDREVLAYMITRAISPVPSQVQSQKKRCSSNRASKRLPLFQCGCFECYTSYWEKWDTSPNKELIHQAIEGFEDHLARKCEENLASKKNGRARKKESKNLYPVFPALDSISLVEEKPEIVSSPVMNQIEAEIEKDENFGEEEDAKGSPFADMAIVVAESPGSCLHKALVNKVLLLPVAVSMLSSRFRSLWNQTN